VCTLLLIDCFNKSLPTFIEIGSYLTDSEQKKSWCVMLRHSVCDINKLSACKQSCLKHVLTMINSHCMHDDLKVLLCLLLVSSLI